jgi:hypothetical protein
MTFVSESDALLVTFVPQTTAKVNNSTILSHSIGTCGAKSETSSSFETETKTRNRVKSG